MIKYHIDRYLLEHALFLMQACMFVAVAKCRSMVTMLARGRGLWESSKRGDCVR
jgi:hypothetical protein